VQTQTGTARPVLRYGQPLLHRTCAPVTSFDAELERLVADMFASMYVAEGVGLAANQIGVGLRVFVYDCPDSSGEHQVGHIVNPVLRMASGLAPSVTMAEACLSVPGQQADLTRAAVATVDGVDVRGSAITVTGTGVLAQCLQHETDHLEGIVYVDRLPDKQRAAILSAAGLPTAPPGRVS
jgi:peptide deformylase